MGFFDFLRKQLGWLSSPPVEPATEWCVIDIAGRETYLLDLTATETYLIDIEATCPCEC